MRHNAWVLLLLAFAGAGCASTTIRAQVVDAETRQPIAGAVVLGVWTKVVGGGLYHHELVGVRETESDVEGRFELERLPASGLDGEGDGQAITVYKFGYLAWSNIYLFRANLRENQRVPREIPLERFPDGESHRRHLDFIDNARHSTMYPLESSARFWNALQAERELMLREKR